MKNLFLYVFLLLSLNSFTQSFEWASQVGGGPSDGASALAVDHLGNVYVTGTFAGMADLDPGPETLIFSAPTQGNAYIQKLDPEGKLIWAKQIASTERSSGEAIVVDSTGNVTLQGLFAGTVDLDPGTGTINVTKEGFGSDLFVIQLDPMGDLLWQQYAQGSGGVISSSIAMDDLANIYIAGHFSGEATFDPEGTNMILNATGITDGFIEKIDMDGNIVWLKQIENEDIINVTAMTCDPSGNTYLTGVFEETTDFDPGPEAFELTTIGENDIFILKLDSAGNFNWAKQIGGAENDFGAAIKVDGLGNICLLGLFKETVDFDPGADVVNLSDIGGEDIFVLKLDATANFDWVKQISGQGSNIGRDLAIDEMGQIYITGSFRNTIDFDPGPAVTEVTAFQSSDIFIEKLSPEGDFIWVEAIGGGGTDIGEGLALHWSGKMYISGRFAETVDFDPGAGVTELTSAGSLDGFTLKMDIGTVSSAWTPDEDATMLSIYPNPTTSQVTIEGRDANDSHIEIYDLFGKPVTKFTTLLSVNEEKCTLDLSNLPAGIYILKTNNQTGKIIKR